MFFLTIVMCGIPAPDSHVYIDEPLFDRNCHCMCFLTPPEAKGLLILITRTITVITYRCHYYSPAIR